MRNALRRTADGSRRLHPHAPDTDAEDVELRVSLLFFGAAGPGVIPKLIDRIESDDLQAREGAWDLMQRVVEHAAEMHGLTADFSVHQHVPALVNQPQWVKRLLPSVERVWASWS